MRRSHVALLFLSSSTPRLLFLSPSTGKASHSLNLTRDLSTVLPRQRDRESKYSLQPQMNTMPAASPKSTFTPALPSPLNPDRHDATPRPSRTKRRRAAGNKGAAETPTQRLMRQKAAIAWSEMGRDRYTQQQHGSMSEKDVLRVMALDTQSPSQLNQGNGWPMVARHTRGQLARSASYPAAGGNGPFIIDFTDVPLYFVPGGDKQILPGVAPRQQRSPGWTCCHLFLLLVLACVLGASYAFRFESLGRHCLGLS